MRAQHSLAQNQNSSSLFSLTHSLTHHSFSLSLSLSSSSGVSLRPPRRPHSPLLPLPLLPPPPAASCTLAASSMPASMPRPACAAPTHVMAERVQALHAHYAARSNAKLQDELRANHVVFSNLRKARGGSAAAVGASGGP